MMTRLSKQGAEEDPRDYFVKGAVWKGRLLYDGDWDEAYVLNIEESMCNDTTTGTHCAFGEEENVEVRIWRNDGTTRVRISDGESMLAGALDLSRREMTGAAHSVHSNGKKEAVGEFRLLWQQAFDDSN